MPDFIINTGRLLSDVLTWVLFLIPLGAGAMIAWHAWQKNLSDGDAAEISDRDKKIKSILKTSVIAFIGSGLVTAVVAYYI